MKRKYSDDDGDEVVKKKSGHEKRKKRKKHKHKHSKRKVLSSSSSDEAVGPLPAPTNVGRNANEQTENSKAFQPMTKEQWEKEQSKITRLYDPETGRHRLIRGSGEIIEEIVSKDRQKKINREATAMDGKFYQDYAQKLLR